MPEPTTLLIGSRILEAVKTLLGLRSDLAKAKIERRGRIGDLFSQISDCLEGTAKEIRAGTYPHGRCAEMGQYAKELPDAIGDELGKGKATTIAATLAEAHEVERLFSNPMTPEGIAEISKLDEAAGILRAISNVVRV
jgi:hypothetical protein